MHIQIQKTYEAKEDIMEIIGLIIIVVVVMAYYGIFGSVEIASDMAQTELRDAQRTQKARIVKKYVNYEVHEEQFTAAKENLAKLDALEL